ncbi:Hsp70 family protein [Planctobacterium marinum]|uniref:Hsp70 family protein n=1 Tax=Planctobacterium marinum TaxID=1631968 RepID=UPI001E4666E3|nr:Hsp70 family protein [Planctobacterium marinum]MCC2605910.1 Hsp70 family protein [Planctobacterium marinum]
MSEARFSVGIDLGTTHCVLSYTEIDNENQQTQAILGIPQLVAPGQVEQREALPSFLFLPNAAQFDSQQLALPWSQEYPVTGQFARDLGQKTPDRLISSAKSWLCHSQVDRRSGILPIDAPEDVTRLSPFDASKVYLQHLHSAWQQQFPDAPLNEQQVVITVPASFDPAARELTMAAAAEAGLDHAVLLEEPQAALYSWIAKAGDNWRVQVSVGDIILVVDIGGGTTDLSLMAVSEEQGALQLTRIAVGDHILLGGDNMDLTLAHVVAQKLAQRGNRLQPWQINGLAHACRSAKETLLSDNDTQQVPLVVPSRGSSLMGGSLRAELTRDEVQRVLIEGFFPVVPADAAPQKRGRAALSTVSLPFEQDAAITRHLAAFLQKQKQASEHLHGFNGDNANSFMHPTAILFNGGVAKADNIVTRITEVVNSWLSSEQDNGLKVLTGIDVDQAVAKGASYYGQVRLGDGIRIRGGTAAAYYVGIESAMPAIPGMPPPMEAYCLAPFGMEEGTEANLPSQVFSLVVGEPVRFSFYESKTRREDQPGTRLDFWSEEELTELPEIEVTLHSDKYKAGDTASVQLLASINELGTLQLSAMDVNSDDHWQVSFDTRN